MRIPDAKEQTENASKDAVEPEKADVDEEGITHKVYTQESLTPTRTSEDDAPVCTLHNKIMRKRLRKDGGYWFDHRWQENGIWQQCSGRPWVNRKEIDIPQYEDYS